MSNESEIVYLTNNSIKCDKCNLFKIGMRVEQCKCVFGEEHSKASE